MTRWTRAFALTVALAAPVAAQPMGPPDGGPGGGRGFGPPRFLARLFPPSLVMRSQEQLKLTDAQRDAIKTAMVETERELVEVRWTLEAESEKLDQVLQREQVDEAAALAQMDRVLAAEDGMKRRHLALLVRIRNLLTPDQRAQLKTLQASEPPRPGPPGD
jgi:Spy/CpxP family protein refolding chaperone